ncbi:MAG TPA: ester cyclase [Xanthobacteraceae bacterium]
MSATPRELVERFYGIVWNQADEAEARRILDAGFRFRGSLGPELRGPDGFISYHRAVHAALENFTCIVDELIETPDRAAVRLSFHGRHRAGFFGVAPTGKEIRWSGAAFFSVANGKIIELWVLGDVEAVRRQLAPDSPAESFSV